MYRGFETVKNPDIFRSNFFCSINDVASVFSSQIFLSEKKFFDHIFFYPYDEWPTPMGTKNLYQNRANPFFSGFFKFVGTTMAQICIAKSV